MKTYSELLRDPRWQKRRLEIMERAGWACETCGDKGTTFNVHHKIYRKGAAPWEYEDDELQALCENCHHASHAIKTALNALIANFDLFDLERLLGYADSLSAIDSIRDGEALKFPITVRSAAHSYGLMDGIWNWNSGGGDDRPMAECLCDHRIIDDELLCQLGEGQMPAPGPRQ